eukprot:CAMPEP_0175224194 /NCGR_PEP_ID=MMETSP0093-20121207/21723_1 /TAXON_ID=311494 /ORGANISM="Alexandrium monilatum, Strain CCMP3105" /LENGTH=272 /DNA_ID=CAMNT_0016517823 /DNA_START=170 /DNA_END=988 /DNA_ORIENTATION=+
MALQRLSPSSLDHAPGPSSMPLWQVASRRALQPSMADIPQDSGVSPISAGGEQQPGLEVSKLHTMVHTYHSTELDRDVELVASLTFGFTNGSYAQYPEWNVELQKLRKLSMKSIMSYELPLAGQYLKRVTAFVQDSDWHCVEFDLHSEANSNSLHCCNSMGCSVAACSCTGMALSHVAPEGFQIVGLSMREGRFSFWPESISVAPLPPWGHNVALAGVLVCLAVAVLAAGATAAVWMASKSCRARRQARGRGSRTEGLLLSEAISTGPQHVL